MKTLKKLLSITIILFSVASFSQDKIRGNKEVISDIRPVSAFTKIEILSNVDVELVASATQEIVVVADSNLQEVITTEVSKGVLRIKTLARITRKKELKIIVKVDDNLSEIAIREEAKVFSEASINVKTLTVNSYTNANINLKLNAQNAIINAEKSSNVNLDVVSDMLDISLEDGAKFKGNVNTKRLNTELKGKSFINIKGNAEEALVEITENSTFKGKPLFIQDAEIRISNNGDAEVNCTDNANIYMSNNAKVDLFSNPKIALIEFFDKAVLRKK
jgi:hypothetical protein